MMTDETNDAVAFYKVELERVTAACDAAVARAVADRDAAVKSERRLWGAYALAKGAAEYANGMLEACAAEAHDDGHIDHETLNGVIDRVTKAISRAEVAAGVAVVGA